MLPAVVLLDDLLAAARRPTPSVPPGAARLPGWRGYLGIGALGATALLGVWVQVLGVSFIWDHHIRLSRDFGQAWLGVPNRSGAAAIERDGLCGACFEDMHRMQWLPPFHPIDGHRWLLRHVARGHDWPEAAKDAPWARYTRIPVDLSGVYKNVRLDWWFFELRHASLPLALILLILLTTGTAYTTWVFVRDLRR
jgi:hypothetical protein